MATIKEKLLLESEKDYNTIILHREGLFYVAYEHSAWLFHNFVQNFKTKKTFVKSVGGEVVSLGFPASSLERFSGICRIVTEDNLVRMQLNDCTVSDKDNFETWKSKQGTDDCKAAESDSTTANCDDIYNMIRNFPVESKTPVDCMLFLIEIKKMLK